MYVLDAANASLYELSIVCLTWFLASMTFMSASSLFNLALLIFPETWYLLKSGIDIENDNDLLDLSRKIVVKYELNNNNTEIYDEEKRQELLCN